MHRTHAHDRTYTQARLLDIHRATANLRAAGRIERIVLAVNRSDYMLDEPSGTLMQVRAECRLHIMIRAPSVRA